MRPILILPIFLTAFRMLVIAQPAIHLNRLTTIPFSYTCRTVPVNTSIQIDGNITEEEWQTAAWTQPFQDIEGPELPTPDFETRVRMLWDNQFLYIAAELEETHIWATLKNHDDIIYRDNDFEVFISGDPTDQEYYEVEVNPFGTIFDLLLPKPYRDGGRANIPWNVPNLTCAVQLNGTINKPDDTDRGWTVEMRLPFAELSKSHSGRSPMPGSVWRINFSRVEYDVTRTATGYEKKTGSNGKPLPEHNWVWSPQGIIDMHFPERWGYILFETETTTSKEPGEMHAEISNRCLWSVYYAQRKHKRETGTFFHTIPAWAESEIRKQIPSGSTLTIKKNRNSWYATLKENNAQNSTYLKIDRSGNLKTIQP